MGLFETPDQEKAWIWQRIQELREDYIREMQRDMMDSSERTDAIYAQILKLRARYRGLGGILYGNDEENDEESTE